MSAERHMLVLWELSDKGNEMKPMESTQFTYFPKNGNGELRVYIPSEDFSLR